FGFNFLELAPKVLMDHTERTTEKVSNSIRERRIVAFDETFFGKIGILADGDFTHQIVAKRFCTVFISEHEWIDNVARAFAHLCATKIPPAVNQQLRNLVVRKSNRVQHDEPVNTVRRHENVFTDDLERRPFVTE